MNDAMETAPSAPPKKLLEPHTIRIPERLSIEIDKLVESVSRRTGERPERVRRAVEIAIIQRGVAALRAQEGSR